MKTEVRAGIKYSLPEVTLLQETGIGTAEIAARTCYDSFDSSENGCVTGLNFLLTENTQPAHVIKSNIDTVNQIEHSDLLDTLAWTYFHHSILEHANLTYLVRGTSRGVLQEHARHRIQAISVRSTRYTMQDVLHAFNASVSFGTVLAKDDFYKLIKHMQMFVVQDNAEHIEIISMYNKLFTQRQEIGKEAFFELTMSRSARDVYNNHEVFESPEELFNALCDTKSKRNVGDNFKWIVTDNWKVDMVVTFNLRSLKNYLTLRDSGAAYFGIQWLAQAMKEVTPDKYLNLIVKDK